jgi:hypothetical protein
MSLDTVINASMNQPRRPANASGADGWWGQNGLPGGRAAGAGLHAGLQAWQTRQNLSVPGAGGHIGRRPECGLSGQLRHRRACRRSTSWQISGAASAQRRLPASMCRHGFGEPPSPPSLSRHARNNGAILDNMPLVDTLHRAISLPGIDKAPASRTLDAWRSPLPATPAACTGPFATPRSDRADSRGLGAARPARRVPALTIDHLMASSAIPFLFPATPLWVDGHREFFGDGSMRQVSPLSPAMHLGAKHPGGGRGAARARRTGWQRQVRTPAPTLGSIAGHAMASVFHDTLQADVEQAQRVTQTLKQLPREVPRPALPPWKCAGDPAQPVAGRAGPDSRAGTAGLGAPCAGRAGDAQGQRAGAGQLPAVRTGFVQA